MFFAWLIKKIGALLVKVQGWKYDPDMFEKIKHCVILGVPHTSNLDFLIVIGIFEIVGFPVRFTIKKEWLVWPFRNFMTSLGAIPIDRSKHASSTDAMAALFKEYDNLALVVTAEGTRSKVKRWRSGFYHTAHKAGVPIALGVLNYRDRKLGIGKLIQPSGDFDRDMREVTDFYREFIKCGRNPEYGSLDERFE